MLGKFTGKDKSDAREIISWITEDGNDQEPTKSGFLWKR